MKEIKVTYLEVSDCDFTGIEMSVNGTVYTNMHCPSWAEEGVKTWPNQTMVIWCTPEFIQTFINLNNLKPCKDTK